MALGVKADRALRVAVTLPIHAYRLALSPLLGPRCRFQPTCSEYAIAAIARHGALKGIALAMKRLLRCHPVRWLGGGSGFDPVPEAAPWHDIFGALPKGPRMKRDA